MASIPWAQLLEEVEASAALSLRLLSQCLMHAWVLGRITAMGSGFEVWTGGVCRVKPIEFLVQLALHALFGESSTEAVGRVGRSSEMQWWHHGRGLLAFETLEVSR